MYHEKRFNFLPVKHLCDKLCLNKRREDLNCYQLSIVIHHFGICGFYFRVGSLEENK